MIAVAICIAAVLWVSWTVVREEKVGLPLGYLFIYFFNLGFGCYMVCLATAKVWERGGVNLSCGFYPNKLKA